MALALGRWLDPVLDLVFPAVCPVCLDRSDEPAQRPVLRALLARRFRSSSARAARSAASPSPGLAARSRATRVGARPRPTPSPGPSPRTGTACERRSTRSSSASRPVLATPLGRLLADVGARALPVPPADWAEGLVPVPLHPARLAERGFNQAELLAAPCARPLAASPSSRAR